MKPIIKSLLIIAAAGLTFSACKKDQTKVVLHPESAVATLTASTSTITLDSNNKAANAVTFTWDSVNYGIRTNITYVLQFDLPSDNFKKPTNVTVGNNMYTYSYADSDFNTLALKLGDSSSGSIQVRLLAYVNAGSLFYDSVYSNPVSITTSTYILTTPVVFSYLWVVGDYMGWTWAPAGNPNKADSLASTKSDGNYEGFVIISGGTGTDQFKICKAGTWDGAFANASSTVTTSGFVTTETTNTAGGTTNNLSVPQNGYYYMQLDTNALNFKATLVNSVSVYGTATSAAVPLTYDSVSQQWAASGVSLSAGNIQFFINRGDVSSVTFGKTTAANQVAAGGDVITVATAGTYKVSLNLSKPAAYTYTLSQ